MSKQQNNGLAHTKTFFLISVYTINAKRNCPHVPINKFNQFNKFSPDSFFQLA